MGRRAAGPWCGSLHAMNRRTFVRLSAALAATWNAPALLAQEHERKAERPLPPSIAALTSMRDQA